MFCNRRSLERMVIDIIANTITGKLCNGLIAVEILLPKDIILVNMQKPSRKKDNIAKTNAITFMTSPCSFFIKRPIIVKMIDISGNSSRGKAPVILSDEIA